MTLSNAKGVGKLTHTRVWERARPVAALLTDAKAAAQSRLWLASLRVQSQHRLKEAVPLSAGTEELDWPSPAPESQSHSSDRAAVALTASGTDLLQGIGNVLLGFQEVRFSVL